MKILIVADQFITEDLWKRCIAEELRNIEIQFQVIETTWPVTPLISNDEISEFLGPVGEICTAVRDATIVVTNHGPITKQILENARKLKLIGCCRSGPTNVNANEATMRGIPIAYNPARNASAVAEFTIGLMIAITRNINISDIYLRRGLWRGDFYRHDLAGSELSQLSVGLIGFGKIGKLVFNLLKSFGSKIYAYDPAVNAADTAFDANICFLSFEETLKKSDIVSLHARLTPQTKGMIGEKELFLIKKGSYLINTARGALVDQQALYAALKSGHLAGAALDCFNEEPLLPSSPLIHLENVILTSHIAGSSQSSAWRSARGIAREIRRFLVGEETENCYNCHLL